MLQLSSFNKIIGKELHNSITGKSVGYSSRLEKYLPEIVNHNPETLSSPSDKILSLLQHELLFRGLIVPQNITTSSKQEEIYLTELVPIKLPTTGFFNSKVVDFRGLDKNSDKKMVLFLGVPCDLGAPRPGTRFGPQILRERSLNFNFRGRNFSVFDTSSKSDILKEKSVYDLGNITLPQVELSNWLKTIENVISQLPKSSIPITIGGDHSLSLGAIRGIYTKNQSTFTVVQMDYHLDVQIWGKFVNSKPTLDKPTHANFMSWIRNDIPDLKILQIGIFDYQSIDCSTNQSIQTTEYLKNFSEILTNFSILSKEDKEIYRELPRDQNVYLTIDVDVINYNYMSHTGFPSATGISIEHFIKIIRYLCIHNNIIGIDIMEFGKSHKDHEHYEMATLINCVILDIIKLGIFKDK